MPSACLRLEAFKNENSTCDEVSSLNIPIHRDKEVQKRQIVSKGEQVYKLNCSS